MTDDVPLDPVTRREAIATPCAMGAALAAAALVPGIGLAETAPAPAATGEGPGRSLPARWLPVPDTVSPELRGVIARPLAPGWDMIPTDAEGWRAFAKASAEVAAPDIAKIKERLGVVVTPDTIAGVPVFRIEPPEIAPGSEDRLLMHLHGGGYVLFPGEAGAGEGMLVAAYARMRVVSVDYRMPPDDPFPAALEDAKAVYAALAATTGPERMGVFGASAGGGLTLALMLALKAAGLPLPAAIAPGTPWCDLTGAGDSLQANAFVDNVLVAATGWTTGAAPLYAGGHDRTDPLISPINGDFTGLPPAILTSGTRDLLLSLTVRAHRRLRAAGVPAELQVFEGQSHAQFLELFVPETEEALGEIGAFFARHLA